jgi:hypothetical protein
MGKFHILGKWPAASARDPNLSGSIAHTPEPGLHRRVCAAIIRRLSYRGRTGHARTTACFNRRRKTDKCETHA